MPRVSEQSSDADLLRAVAAEQTAALRLLHQRHAGWLRARLRRRCADPDVVDAAIQDTFLAVWKDAHRFAETAADPAVFPVTRRGSSTGGRRSSRWRDCCRRAR